MLPFNQWESVSSVFYFQNENITCGIMLDGIAAHPSYGVGAGSE
jgi:hypothetical protein